MGRKYKKKPANLQKIALERIQTLFKEAKTSSKYSDRYVFLARNIGMKYKVRLPSELKRRFCSNCKKYLIPGKNLRIRLNNHKITYLCLECKHFWRKPYLKEIKLKRETNLQNRISSKQTC